MFEDTNGIVRMKSKIHNIFLNSSKTGFLSGSSEPSTDGSDQWSIHKDSNSDSYFIRSIINDRYLICYEDGSVSTTEEYGPQLWNIEFLTGELCFISLPEKDKRITCNPFGALGMSENWKGWEVWRFIEAGNGNVRISSWTHSQHILCSDSSGKVTTTKNLLGDWEKWIVERAPDGFDGIIIKSVSHGRYLRSNGGHIDTSERFEGTSTTWHLDAGHCNRFLISSIAHDKRICGSKDSVFSTGNRKEWEVWELTKLENNFVTLKSTAFGKYLTFNGHELTVNDELHDNGIWKLEECEKAQGVYIKSKNHKAAISCNKSGSLVVVLGCTGISESWSLEPSMPSTISGNQIKKYSLAGSFAVASIIAAPFAVMGIIGAVGFGAEGIAAGSVAAGMMSAEAIAAGGGVVAGGTVATLQSIGAAGLGLAGTSAAMGAGALLGGSALGISVAISGVGNKSSGEGAEVEKKSVNRPFCDWRSW